MATEKTRRPSPLQRSILIALAALDQRGTDLVRTRELESLLAQADGRPVYGNNLRASCRRMEEAGMVRMLRNKKSLQIAVELTDAGRDMAIPLLAAEQQAETARKRERDVRVLPVRPENGTRTAHDVAIDGTVYQVWRGDFVVRLDGSTCLQLWHQNDQRTVLEGDALQVATWYEVCFAAGLPVQCQVNQNSEPS